MLLLFIRPWNWSSWANRLNSTENWWTRFPSQTVYIHFYATQPVE